MGAFGEKLRKQREHRGLSLDAISTTTKISTRMLRAIEDEHFDQLPGGVFNKGFVRAYARQVGLDEEEAVTDYLAALRESQVQSQTILPNFRAPAGRSAVDADEPDHHDNGRNSAAAGRSDDRRIHPDRRSDARRIQDRHNEDRHREGRVSVPGQLYPGKSHLDENRAEDVPSSAFSFLNLDSTPSAPHPTRPEPVAPASISTHDSSPRARWEKLAIPLLVVVLALAFWALYRHNHPAATSRPTASQPVGATQPAPFSSPTAVPAPAVAPAVTSPSAVNASPKPLPAATTASPKPSSAAAPPATHNPATPAAPVVKPPAAQAQTPTSAAKPSPTFTLVIRATETSWVAITADGQPVAHETLFAPAATSVKATREIVVRTGNAAGISFVLNHQEIPAQGAPGEVRTYTFDATGLRDSTISQPAPTTR